VDLNLCSLAKQFSDESAAYELVEQLRWPGGPVCLHCGDTGRAYFLKARNGYRTTSTGRTSYRRLWKCAECRKQFSVLVSTIFEATHVPLSKWLLAIYMMNANKNGTAAYELHRTLGVTNKTAWFMLHRIREAMRQAPLAGMFVGTVVSDETWIGGKPRNRHQQGRPARLPGGGRGRAGTPKDKVPVVSLILKQTGEVRSRVVPSVTGATLRKVIAEQVDMSRSVLHTDCGTFYPQIGAEFIRHEFVDHSSFEYVRGDVSTNLAEGYFSQLKRSLDGTHHHVSPQHLHRYLAEFDYRYTAPQDARQRAHGDAVRPRRWSAAHLQSHQGELTAFDVAPTCIGDAAHREQVNDARSVSLPVPNPYRWISDCRIPDLIKRLLGHLGDRNAWMGIWPVAQLDQPSLNGTGFGVVSKYPVSKRPDVAKWHVGQL
jgi:transposase-like protein